LKKNAALETNKQLRGSTIIGEFGISENDPLIVLPVVSDETFPRVVSVSNQNDVCVLMANFKRIPCPSSYAKPRTLIEWELRADNPIFCHRPRCSTIPISAEFGVFSQFLKDLYGIEVDQGDLQFSLHMCTELENVFEKEEKRTSVLQKLLVEWLKDTGLEFFTAQYRSSTGDGGFFKGGTACIFLEGKNDFCLGGWCPYVQATAVYGTYILEKLSRSLSKETFPQSANPCFIIYTAGPFLGIAGGLVHESKVICDPLTPMFTLMYEPWNRYDFSSDL
jgi:hypothetical protein